jgi:hypothetical protein
MPSKRLNLLAPGCVAMVLAATAVGAIGSKPRYVRVAHGQVAGESWSLAVEGRKGKRCYKQTLRGSSAEGQTALCLPDRRPPRNWNPLGGIGDEKAIVLLDVTKKRVRSVRLRIEHPHSGRKRWARLNTHRVSFAEAREARVTRNFRFLVLASRGTICVTKVVMFDGSGSRIRTLTMPSCEY